LDPINLYKIESHILSRLMVFEDGGFLSFRIHEWEVRWQMKKQPR